MPKEESKYIHLRISVPLWNKVKKDAERTNRTIVAMGREVVEQYYKGKR